MKIYFLKRKKNKNMDFCIPNILNQHFEKHVQDNEHDDEMYTNFVLLTIEQYPWVLNYSYDVEE
jgi:hypothetical protein